MFSLDQFISDCRDALAADQSHRFVREVVARAVSDPAGVLKGLGEPKRAEIQTLYHSTDLTILNVIWAPKMTIMPRRSPYVGLYRLVWWSRGQHLLASDPRRPRRQGMRPCAVRERRQTPRAQHHSFRDQSDSPPDRRHSRVPRRFSSRRSAANGIRNRCWKGASTLSGRCSGSKLRMRFLEGRERGTSAC
jgi:hypothetical protein